MIELKKKKWEVKSKRLSSGNDFEKRSGERIRVKGEKKPGSGGKTAKGKGQGGGE